MEKIKFAFIVMPLFLLLGFIFCNSNNNTPIIRDKITLNTTSKNEILHFIQENLKDEYNLFTLHNTKEAVILIERMRKNYVHNIVAYEDVKRIVKRRLKVDDLYNNASIEVKDKECEFLLKDDMVFVKVVAFYTLLTNSIDTDSAKQIISSGGASYSFTIIKQDGKYFINEKTNNDNLSQ